MKCDSARDWNGQISGEIELSSADLQAVYGGGSCPGSNGFSYGRNFSQGPGYNYGGFSDNGYGNGFNEFPPCMTPPPPCPYSY